VSFISPPEAEAYAEASTTPVRPELNALAEETRATLQSPQMLTGPVEGRLLEMLVHLVRPTTVLEIGTYSGYSALSMAGAMPPDAQLITCELSEEHAAFARRHFQHSKYADRIDLRVGPALDTLSALEGPFDLVFIDADKTGYEAYFEAVLPKLSSHGLIVIDNTLWSGRVYTEGEDDENTVALRELNARLASDPRVVVVQLTVRDGVTLIRRA
jgi:caffeoyl-CoA O-methyltransferase